MEIYIAFVRESCEAPRIVGVFTTPALAHRAIAEALEKAESRFHAGFVEERSVHATLHPA